MNDKKLEGLLSAAGNKLLQPSDSVDELLTLLEKVEDLLIRVDQSPSDSMTIALSPCLRGLVAKDILTHSDADVKAAVAVCISEITRITAPDSPYEEYVMKEIFQLIVSTFERLWDSGSRSYYKRISILETVAKVRSCVMMLDMECDSLIAEMFQHFLKTIRENQPDNVFNSMETIMTLVFEESEEISLELLSLILAAVRKDDEEQHSTMARKLVERVLQNCGAKLKPYIVQSLENLNHSITDYSSVVARICEETSGADEGNDTGSCAERSLHEKTAAGVASVGETLASVSNSSKPVMSNGLKEAALVDAVGASEASKKPDDSSNSNRRERRVVIKLSEKTAKESQARPENLDVSKLEKPVPNSVNKKERTPQQKGRKSGSLKKSVEPKLSEQGPTDVAKQSNEVLDSGKSKHKETGSSQQMDVATDPVPPVKGRENAVQPSSPRDLESDSVNVLSPSNDGSFVRKGGRVRKKSYIACQATPSAEVAKTKIPEEMTDANVKADKKSGKKVQREGLEKKQKGEKSDRGNDGENSTADEKESTVWKFGAKSTKGKGLSGENVHAREGLEKKQKGEKINRGTDGENSTLDEKESTMLKSGAKSTKDKGLSREKVQAREGLEKKKKGEKSDRGNDGENSTVVEKESTMLKSGAKSTKDKGLSREKVQAREGLEKKKKGEKSDRGNDGENSTVVEKESTMLKSGAKSTKDKGLLGEKVQAREGLEKKQKGEKSDRGNDGENSTVDEKESTMLKSGAKSTKDKGLPGEKNSGIKKKHTPGKEQTADSVEYGEELVGSRLKVWWPLDKTYYEGVIESFDPVGKKHKVHYCDGEVEILTLKTERWELLKSDSDDEAGSGGGEDPASKQKKEKLNSSSSTKKRKVEAASRRGSGSSKKLKASAKKSATVTEDETEVDGCKTIKPDAKKDGKLKDDDVKKVAKKMDPETPKDKARPEQDKLKVIKGGGESSKVDGKSKSNGTGKLKSKSSKPKEKETVKEKSPELLVEIAKRKSSESSKAKQSEAKSAKKRQKEVN